MDALLTQLPEYGLLGLLLGLALIILGLIARELKTSWNDRLADQKAMAEVLSANAVTLKDVIASNESRTRAHEAMVRVQELSAQAQVMQTEEIRRLHASQEKTAAELARLRELLLQRGN